MENRQQSRGFKLTWVNFNPVKDNLRLEEYAKKRKNNLKHVVIEIFDEHLDPWRKYLTKERFNLS